MTDLEFIFKKCKAAHYQSWTEEDIKQCKKKLIGLTHEELRLLSTSKWMSRLSPLYNTMFEQLYKKELQVVVDELNSKTTIELIEAMKEVKSAYRKQKIPEILYERYESMDNEDKKKVSRLLVRKGFINTQKK